MNNYTIEQQKQLAEFGEYEVYEFEGRLYNPVSGHHEDLLFSLSDFNIIKALEAKMCEELGVKYVERYRIQGVFHVIYWDSEYENRLIIKGTSKETNNLEAEKEAILNAVIKHIESKKHLSGAHALTKQIKESETIPDHILKKKFDI
jgi:hypothetical protein